MPHLVLEYTDNVAQEVAYDEMFAALHQILVQTTGASLAACKSRAVQLQRYYLAEGQPDGAFVHLTIGLLAGRSDEQKMEATRQCAQVLAAHYRPSLDALGLQISVELRDIHRESYYKVS